MHPIAFIEKWLYRAISHLKFKIISLNWGRKVFVLYGKDRDHLLDKFFFMYIMSCDPFIYK